MKHIIWNSPREIDIDEMLKHAHKHTNAHFLPFSFINAFSIHFYYIIQMMNGIGLFVLKCTSKIPIDIWKVTGPSSIYLTQKDKC